MLNHCKSIYPSSNSVLKTLYYTFLDYIIPLPFRLHNKHTKCNAWLSSLPKAQSECFKIRAIQAIRWKCRVAAYWIPSHPTETSSTDRHITVTGVHWNKGKRTAALSKTIKEETALFSFIVASVFSFFYCSFSFLPLTVFSTTQHPLACAYFPYFFLFCSCLFIFVSSTLIQPIIISLHSYPSPTLGNHNIGPTYKPDPSLICVISSLVLKQSH